MTGFEPATPSLGSLCSSQLSYTRIPHYYITVYLDIISQVERRKTGDLITEKLNPRTKDIDKLSVKDAVRLVLTEDASVIEAVSSQKENIAAASELVIQSIRSGGRVFFVGAGTSGRLGVLESAECPPTFGTDPSQFQAVMAGGRDAVWESVEGAEDSYTDSAEELGRRRLREEDTVIAIAASSSTPYALGALDFGRRVGSGTVFITCNPAEKNLSDVLISLPVGPEVIAGSTRLKSATATKMVLNTITTISMVMTGKTLGNLMVDVQPRSGKLRDRAVRIVCHVCGTDEDMAINLLENSKWNVKAAIVMHNRSVGLDEALRLLEHAEGILYKVLDT